jgi:uncharacterized protein YhdP
MARKRYRVTGPWANPVVEPISGNAGNDGPQPPPDDAG